MAILLGIESTCDETAAAVVVDGQIVKSSVISSQIDLHAKYRGVVPEIASRAHIENILPVLREAVDTAGIPLTELDGIAVAHRPGLIGSLLIGVTAAKTLAWTLNKPLIAVDHVQAHLYSVVLQQSPPQQSSPQQSSIEPRNTAPPSPPTPRPNNLTPQNPLPHPRSTEPSGSAAGPAGPSGPAPPPFPAIGLVCSGGHTALYLLNSWSQITMIGSTIDDAIGEAYDKVAAILGQGYPGGPILDRLSIGANPAAVKLPRSLLDRESLDFSFSGLKTAVLYHVRGVPTRRDPHPQKPLPTQTEINDIAASFQAACIDVIRTKLNRAIDQFSARSVIIGGGVSANRGLRAALQAFSLPVFFPPLAYCTDNAAMIAGLADVHYQAKTFAGLDLDAITYSQFRR
jgi:N6-L-threonylcarbamoyladenine synthase